MTSPESELTPRERILAVAKELGLMMIADFIPFSQSRNKGEKNPSLNWRVQIDLSNDGDSRGVLVTDYSAGCAHAPSYKHADRSLACAELVRLECENGRPYHYSGGSYLSRPGHKSIKPDFVDVLYSLVMDADVIDCASFEEWASNFGYDTDSRKAEATYRQCLDIALKLRNAIGEAGLAKLREACQDY